MTPAKPPALWSKHRGVAYKIATSGEYWLPGSDFDDVKQEALIALWEAARCYDPSKGPFPRFAATVIHRRLKDAVKGANRLKHRVLTDADRCVSEELAG